nr:MAG TPA: hypothetical protein [Caudoviricetes sp.]DAT95819.1 MAG TPA: hypothetical protein [Caudoviricetes sp.]DAZ70331.1 MAG TPA: hypothetical protein [Caudoviricetes sp.]
MKPIEDFSSVGFIFSPVFSETPFSCSWDSEEVVRT